MAVYMIADTRFTRVPDVNGKLHYGSKNWHVRYYANISENGGIDMRSMREFKAGDIVQDVFLTDDGAKSVGDKILIRSDDSEWVLDVMPIVDGAPDVPGYVLCAITDTSGKRYYAAAAYPSSNGKYPDIYTDNPIFYSQHSIEGY